MFFHGLIVAIHLIFATLFEKLFSRYISISYLMSSLDAVDSFAGKPIHTIVLPLNVLLARHPDLASVGLPVETRPADASLLKQGFLFRDRDSLSIRDGNSSRVVTPSIGPLPSSRDAWYLTAAAITTIQASIFDEAQRALATSESVPKSLPPFRSVDHAQERLVFWLGTALDVHRLPLSVLGGKGVHVPLSSRDTAAQIARFAGEKGILRKYVYRPSNTRPSVNVEGAVGSDIIPLLTSLFEKNTCLTLSLCSLEKNDRSGKPLRGFFLVDFEDVKPGLLVVNNSGFSDFFVAR